jgi:hypothetical protein
LIFNRMVFKMSDAEYNLHRSFANLGVNLDLNCNIDSICYNSFVDVKSHPFKEAKDS